MKLKNKKTGEIADVEIQSNCMLVTHQDGRIEQYYFDSIKDLLEWEDYEEPKGTALYWTILTLQNFIENEPDDKWVDLEDCKQMLEKLQAWKRLKDKGFRFIDHIDRDSGQGITRYEWDGYINGEDLDLLFGGEE